MRTTKLFTYLITENNRPMSKDEYYEELDKGAEQARNNPASKEEGRELAIYASHARLVKALEDIEICGAAVIARKIAKDALAEAKALTKCPDCNGTGIVSNQGAGPGHYSAPCARCAKALTGEAEKLGEPEYYLPKTIACERCGQPTINLSGVCVPCQMNKPF